MDAGFLDVFHHAGDVDFLAVADAVDIDLDGVVEVAVDEQGTAGQGGLAAVAHVTGQASDVVEDFHGAAA